MMRTVRSAITATAEFLVTFYSLVYCSGCYHSPDYDAFKIDNFYDGGRVNCFVSELSN